MGYPIGGYRHLLDQVIAVPTVMGFLVAWFVVRWLIAEFFAVDFMFADPPSKGVAGIAPGLAL